MSLKKKLKTTQTLFGTWNLIPSPMLAEIFAASGMDFLIHDLEHGSFDLPALADTIRATQGRGCSSLVRVPDSSVPRIQNCLDQGAEGILIAQTQDAEDAKKAIQSCLHAPQGVRGFNPFTRAANFSGGLTPQLSNDYPCLGVIIETEKAIESFDRILALPELDLIYLGVYDLTGVFGDLGNTKNPKLMSFLETAIPKIRKAGKAAGAMVRTAQEQKFFLNLGVNFVAYSVDTTLIREMSDRLLMNGQT